MKIGLLVGILLMSIVMSACITPLPSSTPAAKSDQPGTFKLEPGWDSAGSPVVVKDVWPGPEPVAQIYTVAVLSWMDLDAPPGAPAVWAIDLKMAPVIITTWSCLKLVTIDLNHSWNLVGNPYIYLGFLRWLFRDLQVWFELETVIQRDPLHQPFIQYFSPSF